MILTGPTIVLNVFASKILRYGFVSGVALGLDLASLIVARESFQLHPLVAAFLGLIVGTIAHYSLAKTLVFDTARIQSKTMEIAAYSLLGFIAMGVSLLIMYLGTEIYGLDYRASKGAAAAVSFFVGYASRKYLLFSSDL